MGWAGTWRLGSVGDGMMRAFGGGARIGGKAGGDISIEESGGEKPEAKQERT